jgi:hypothetical protein
MLKQFKVIKNDPIGFDNLPRSSDYEYSRVNIDRYRAANTIEKGKIDHGQDSKGLTGFSQLMNETYDFNENFLFFRFKNTSSRCFEVQFLEERSIDDGGPHRAQFEDMCREL